MPPPFIHRTVAYLNNGLVSNGPSNIEACISRDFTDQLLKELVDLLKSPKGYDYREIGKKLTERIRETCPEATNEDVVQILSEIKINVANKIYLFPDDTVQDLVSTVITLILDEISKEVETLPEKSAWNSHTDEPFPRPIENGETTYTNLKLYDRISRKLEVSGGFATDYNEVPGIFYSRLLYTPLLLKPDPFIFKTSVAAGAFSVLPEGSENFENRLLVDPIVSASLFAGFSYDITNFLRLRVATEVAPKGWMGYNSPPDLFIPTDVAASVGFKFSPFLISVGWLNEWVPGRLSFYPFYDHSTYFLSTSWMMGPDVSVTTDFDYTQSVLGDEFAGRIGTKFPWGPVNIAFELTGSIAIGADTIVYAPAAFAGATITYGDADAGAVVEQEYHITRKIPKHDYRVKTLFYSDGPTLLAELEGLEESAVTCAPRADGSMTCAFKEFGNQKVTCEGENGLLTCDTEAYIGKAKAHSIIKLESLGGDNYKVTSVDSTLLSPSSSLILNALANSNTYNDLMFQLQDASFADKKAFLEQLTDLLYETYYKDGPWSIEGASHEISNDEMVLAIKTLAFEGKHPQTVVCNGIAAFIAQLAGDWGFDAHSISITTDEMWHQIALIREPKGDWTVINYGDRRFTTGDRAILAVLNDFIKANEYPPQIRYILYGPNGKYEKTIITKTGQIIFKETTAPDEINPFVRNRW